MYNLLVSDLFKLTISRQWNPNNGYPQNETCTVAWNTRKNASVLKIFTGEVLR